MGGKGESEYQGLSVLSFIRHGRAFHASHTPPTLTFGALLPHVRVMLQQHQDKI